jgi:hypothetical protein
MILKYIYTIFVGILLATFIGVGISAFYPGPKQPEFPPDYGAPYKYGLGQDGTPSAEMIARQDEFTAKSKEYQDASKKYNRDVSIIALVSAIVVFVVSIVLKRLTYIADGLLLGGVLTLLYSIIRGFDTEDNMFRFVVVAIGLVVALILGYLKFIRPPTEVRQALARSARNRNAKNGKRVIK